MIIAFWSPHSGQCGVSTNMVLIAHYLAVEYNLRSLIIQPQYGNRTRSFITAGIVAEDRADYYGDTGIDALMANIRTSHCGKEMIDSCVTSIIKDRLDILEGTRRQSRGVYENGYNTDIIASIPVIASRYYDAVLTDTESGNSILSKRILEKADITVINLRQNKSIIEEALDDGKEKKVFYLFSHYSSESRYNISNIHRMYRGITTENSGGIPYNSAIGDAVSEGSLTSFFMRHISVDKDYDIYNCMHEIKQTAEKLHRMIRLPD